MISLLFVAGHETTVNLIGNGTHSLINNPDQFQLVLNDPSVDETMVDEYDEDQRLAICISQLEGDYSENKVKKNKKTEEGSSIEDLLNLNKEKLKGFLQNGRLGLLPTNTTQSQ